MKTLSKVKENNYKYSLSDPDLEKIKEIFFAETDYKIECSKICDMQFRTIDEHSNFIKNGGCSRLIELLGNL